MTELVSRQVMTLPASIRILMITEDKGAGRFGCNRLYLSPRPALLLQPAGNFVRQRLAQAKHEAQLGHDKQRSDGQPHDVVQKGRFAPFVVVTNKLDNPAKYKQQDRK